MIGPEPLMIPSHWDDEHEHIYRKFNSIKEEKDAEEHFIANYVKYRKAQLGDNPNNIPKEVIEKTLDVLIFILEEQYCNAIIDIEEEYNLT